MDFDLENVYTVVNAHEVKIGSKGYFGDDIAELRDKVCDDREPTYELARILEENSGYRFVDTEGYGWHLFYLVEGVDEDMCTEEELTKWLAQGNGIVKSNQFGLCRAYQTFELEDAKKPVSSNLMVRKWGETEWVKPTKEYIDGV